MWQKLLRMVAHFISFSIGMVWWKPVFIIWGLIAAYVTLPQILPGLPIPTVTEFILNWFPIFQWRVWVFVALGILLLFTFLGTYHRFGRLAKRAIELVFDEKTCKIKQLVREDGREVTRVFYRVGVEAIGGFTVEDVQVSLTEIEPKHSPFLPVPLNPMDSDQSAPRFTCNPGAIRYVEVLSYDIDRTAVVPVLGIHAYHRYHGRFTRFNHLIPVSKHGRFTFVLKAEGRNIEPCQRSFILRCGPTQGRWSAILSS